MVKIIKTVIVISISIVFNVNAQENDTISNNINGIQRDNYYSYYVKKETAPAITDWLRHCEVVPIITSEIEGFGYKVENFKLYEIAEGKLIVLDVYLPEHNLGILFNEGHVYPVKETQRSMKVYRLYRNE